MQMSHTYFKQFLFMQCILNNTVLIICSLNTFWCSWQWQSHSLFTCYNRYMLYYKNFYKTNY